MYQTSCFKTPYNTTIDRILEEIDAFDDEELFPSSETLEEEVGGKIC